MARVNGISTGRDVNPPPSSMLATHVVNGHGQPNLSRTDFAQLLEESLGTDDEGQTNVGKDADINLKLYHAIVQIGIEPLIFAEQSDPFRKRFDQGRNVIQLKDCLEVIHLVIQQSPEIIFKNTNPTTVEQHDDLLVYAWLLPTLLSINTQIPDVEIANCCSQILHTCLDIDDSCSCGVCGSILDFLRDLLNAVTREVHSTNAAIGDVTTEPIERSTSARSRATLALCNLRKPADYISAGVFIVQNLLSRSLPRVLALQFKKHLRLLEGSVVSASGVNSNDEQLEAVKSRISGLSLMTSLPTHVPQAVVADEFSDSGRPRKRPRLSIEHPDIEAPRDDVTSIAHSLTKMLTGRGVSDFDSLAMTTLSHFRRLPEQEQCQNIMSIGRTACHLAGTSTSADCLSCDGKPDAVLMFKNSDQIEKLLDTLEALQSHIERGTTTGSAALEAYRRVLNHVSAPGRLNLTTSVAGKFTLQMLRGTSRSSRLKAAVLLQTFVRAIPEDASSVIRSNRVAALEYLQSLWQSGRIAPLEGVVVALTRMAEVVGDEELHIILLRLVEYLGHSNIYISSLVGSELIQLSAALDTNMQALLRPFWRTLSIVVVKNYVSRPAIAQQLCELLGMQISGLLQLIEEQALPYLVLNKDTGLISKITGYRDTPTTSIELCLKPANYPKVFAILLAQAYTDAEDTIMRLLCDIHKEFGEQSLPEWLSIDHSRIACELLKAVDDAGYGKASKVLQGLELLAQLAHRRTSGSSASRRTHYTATFLESNASEIVIHFNNAFENGGMREMNVERRRCLAALGEVVRLGKGRVNMVVPQVCACLRTAMGDEDLCDAAYKAWTMVVANLDEDELTEIIDQTFAITVYHWSSFSDDTHSIAVGMLQQLFKKQKVAIRSHIDMLPSLKNVPDLSNFEQELETLRKQKDELSQLQSYATRLKGDTIIVCQLAATELVETLRNKSDVVQRSLIREQPDPVFADLIRAILDCAVKFKDNELMVLQAAQCLGSLGRVDTSRVDSSREKPTMVVLNNFGVGTETTAFLMFFMQHVVVKAYVSAPTLRSKNFLGWTLQELLKICQLTPEVNSRMRAGGLNTKDRQWFDLPEEIRLVLTPFLSSKFLAPGKKPGKGCTYPLFKPTMSHESWLTTLTLDLLTKGRGQTVDLVFEICWKAVHFSPGTAVSSFLLPFATLNLLLKGAEKEREEILQEMLTILQQPYRNVESLVQDTIRQCSQTVFDVIDYLSKWLQDKRKWYSNAQLRAERGVRDPALETAPAQIEAVDTLLRSIKPQVITQRSIECRSYARALMHWEEYIHSKKKPSDDDYRKLQDIYAQIDEPDGIEGVSSCMHVLNAESQILEHRKAGRWQAAQNWYEMQMTEEPDNIDVQVNLLHALRESGQHDVLLHHFSGITENSSDINARLLPYATEAAWSSAQFDQMRRFVDVERSHDFNVLLGSKMLLLSTETISQRDDIEELWLASAQDISYNSTASISASSDTMLKMHVTEDLRLMVGASADTKTTILETLEKRLQILGTDVAAKHYALNVHRALMHLRQDVFNIKDVSASWLMTAKLARKARVSNQAFDAVLRAANLGDQSVVLEQSKLMWMEGRHRKAIKTLESAIESGAFKAHAYIADKDSMLSRAEGQEQNNMTAKAYVLLGKWLDQAGQTQSEVIIKTFREATTQNRMFERAWYQLGRHYNKILDSERQKSPGKESQPFLTGEAAKTVIDNFLRALACGNKYLFQTLPKMLTLWLELVSNPDVEQDSRRGNTKFHEHLNGQRKKVIAETNAYVKKYVDRLQPVALYTILPQLVARICHQNQQVHEILQSMIAKVIHSFPQQAMWTLMAVTKSVDKTRAQRGLTVINKVVELQKKNTKNMSPTEMRMMISQAQRFTDELLRVADYHIEGKTSKISLARELGFNHKIAPSKLVVPAETCLIPNVPTNNDTATMKIFRAFSKDPTTITAFLDEALVLASLQKPRKMSIRGSDGHVYAILAKPKDDLRKDQRLMEFDTMINRFLKRDIEASKRRLYIRTYAVIPLNEECGVIEWVNSLKTMRDVLLKLYRERNVVIDYGQLRNTLDEICARSKDKARDFTDQVLPLFPPVLRYWFVETFPDPGAWLNARVRYTRSAAVMSMVGHILGLGDRHGENILFEEDNGGVMHVDFNCLFDKGLTFDKPEMVPFRLTHNMVDAFGTFGVEGPFRKCSEITMTLLRDHEDGLMTILETFLHDPTTDFMTAGKRRKPKGDAEGLVPDTAEKMLEGVKAKVRGMLKGESVPLSVGGYVEEMIKQANDRANLAKMYIGWCAFL